MQRKLAAAVILVSFLGIDHPVSAQSLQSPVDSQANARVALPPEARIRHVDVRLLLPIHSDGGVANAKLRVDRMTPAADAGESHRVRNAIIGGVLGTVAGLGLCTAISNVLDESTKRRVSTCTATGNLTFGAGGFAVGALIGAAIR